VTVDGVDSDNRMHKRYAGFYEAQQLVVEELVPGKSILRLVDPRDDQRGGGGTSALNGGVIAYMFDGALGAAVASLAVQTYGDGANDIPGYAESTISLTINYVKPALGDSFEAHGTAIRTGRTVAFAEGKLYDSEGEICATASGVWRLFLPRRSD
jgi:uncharacterized protein (TIGR00369 family)